MDTTALQHARARFAKAQKAAECLKTAVTFDEIESAWSDFLISCATVYTKLEQGSKFHPKSVAWFGQIKRTRRLDPLLQYVHQARNSDEHGIQDITARSATQFKLANSLDVGHGVKLTGITLAPGGELTSLEAFAADGTLLPLPAMHKEDVVKLVPVVNYGITFLPPHYTPRTNLCRCQSG